MPLTRSQGTTQSPDADKGKQKMVEQGRVNTRNQVFLHTFTLSYPSALYTPPFTMEDWNKEAQENQEDQQKMDIGPAPPPRVHFGNWAPKAPTGESQENQGPTMVSKSYYKPINGLFPSSTSLLGCTPSSTGHSDRQHDRRAPQGARGRPVDRVNKVLNSASIAGATRQRLSGATGRTKPAKTASSRHVAPRTRKPAKTPGGVRINVDAKVAPSTFHRPGSLQIVCPRTLF